MAQYDKATDTYILDATDVDPFVMTPGMGDAAVLGDDRDNVVKGNAGGNKVDGGAGNDDLDGGDGNDSLFGGEGDNSLKGGAGDDVYHVHFFDAVFEFEGGGFDTFIAYEDYDLPDNVERLEAPYIPDEEYSSDYYFTGNALDNIIISGDGWDHLDGHLGADTLQGGLGSDKYYIDSPYDVVIELEDQSSDGVYTSISYKLGAHVEDLYATFDAVDLVLTGNELDNHISGTDGNDTIDGGAGADFLSGGAGNDIYFVDNQEDWVDDIDGIDHVITSVSFELDFDLEKLTASGTAALTLDGNSEDNRITGNAGVNTLNGHFGNDTLDGGEGGDWMDGGDGNDAYYVDTSNDRIFEASSEGTADRVHTKVSLTLAPYVERLYASGSGALSLTGNALGNAIYGNDGANKINGGFGKDALKGGGGKDIFLFKAQPSSSNVDRILDFSTRDDTIQLDNAVFKKLGSGSTASPKKLSGSYFTIGTKAKDKNDYLVYDKTKGYLYYDADGSGSGKAVLIATLSKSLKMTYADFYVI